MSIGEGAGVMADAVANVLEDIADGGCRRRRRQRVHIERRGDIVAAEDINVS